MHHEPEIGLVEAHAERGSRDEGLDAVVQQVGLELLAFCGLGGARVGGDGMAPLAQQRGHVVRLGHRQRVDDSRTGQRIQMSREPRGALRRIARRHDRQPKRLTVQATAKHQRVVTADAQLCGDVVDHAVVGGRGGGQHRDVGAQFGDQRADPPVVGPEVMAPVGHTVGFVHHDEACVSRQRGQYLFAEVGVVQPFRADQQHVESAVAHPLVDLVPLGNVARVDRRGVDARPIRGGDLVAHQREQRRDDHGRAVPAGRATAWRR